MGKGKHVKPPIVFQGGVAANKGIRKAFSKYIKQDIIIPKDFEVMGAIGAALLVMEERPKKTKFKGFRIAKLDFKTQSFTHKDCPNNCEVVEFRKDSTIIAHFGDKCGKYDR